MTTVAISSPDLGRYDEQTATVAISSAHSRESWKPVTVEKLSRTMRSAASVSFHAEAGTAPRSARQSAPERLDDLRTQLTGSDDLIDRADFHGPAYVVDAVELRGDLGDLGRPQVGLQLVEFDS